MENRFSFNYNGKNEKRIEEDKEHTQTKKWMFHVNKWNFSTTNANKDDGTSAKSDRTQSKLEKNEIE